MPDAAIEANIWARVLMSTGLCSASTTSQSNPILLTYSAASGEGSESQVPIEGSPAWSRLRTWLMRIFGFHSLKCQPDEIGASGVRLGRQFIRRAAYTVPKELN